MNNSDYIQAFYTQISETPVDTPAFMLYDGDEISTISFGSFKKAVEQAAGYFIERGISRQHIGLAAPNSYDWIVTFYGILLSGNIAIPLNQDLPVHMLLAQCDQADITILCGTDASLEPVLQENTNFTLLTFQQVASQGITAENAKYSVQPDDTILMIFTSGTTGKSKIVEYSSSALYYCLQEKNMLSDLNQSRLAIFPFYHMAGIFEVMIFLGCGRLTKLGRGMKYIFQDMRILEPHCIQMPPTVLESLVKFLRNTKSIEEQQKITGKNLCEMNVVSSNAKIDLYHFMLERGISMQTGYGMTESAGSGTQCIVNERSIGSIGQHRGRTELCIKDGELLMRGPSIMKGYYKDPEETAKVLKDGWLYTGDLARRDEDDFYYIIGRKKNVIILSNGENVNPEEIEDTLSACPHILECMVYGDSKGICADIFTKDESLTKAFVKAYNESVPTYRQVYKINCQSEPLEKTGAGKIKRKENAYV